MMPWSSRFKLLVVGTVLAAGMAGCSEKGGASPEICAAGRAFTTTDKAVEKAAERSSEVQQGAQAAWRSALRALATVLPPGEIRTAAGQLQSASTVVSDTTWNSEQREAHDLIIRYLGSECRGV